MADSKARVALTNDSSTASKASAASLGYMQDRFLSLMDPRPVRRAPIINRGYYIRVKAVDHILKAFLEEARNGAQPSAGVTPIQIVSLGAGFDTLYFRLHEAGLLGPQDVIYEVDLPKVAQKKATTIQQTPELSSRLDPPLNAVPDSAALAEAMRIHEESRQKRRKAKAAAAAAAAAKGLPPPVSSGTSHGASMGGSNASPAAWPQALGGGLYTQRYRLVGVDLCQTALTSARLRAAGVQPDLPTLVLTECVLTYLGPHPADAILGWVASYFDHVAVALYEQIIPSDAFGTFMQGHFLRQNSPLKCIRAYPTLRDQGRRLRGVGFTISEAQSMTTFFRELLDDVERARIEKLEPFDEFEEWQEKLNHYMISVGGKGNLAILPQSATTRERPSSPLPLRSVLTQVQLTAPTTKLSLRDSSRRWTSTRRFAHASCMLDNVVVAYGGVGGPQHRRLADGVVLQIESDDYHVISQPLELDPASQPAPSARMYHSLTAVESHDEEPAEGVTPPDIVGVLLAGRAGPGAPLGDAYMLRLLPGEDADPTRLCVWTAVEITRGQLVPRWRHSSTFIGGHRVAVVGGRTSTGLAPPAVSVLTMDLDADGKIVPRGSWTDCPWAPGHESNGQRATSRMAHAAVAIDTGRVFVFGGLDEKQTVLRDLWRLRLKEDADGNLVCRATPVAMAPALPPRFGHKAELLEGNADSIVVVGGCSTSALPWSERVILIYPHIHTWRYVDMTCGVSVQEATMLFNHDVVADGNRVLAVGGGGNCFSFGTHFDAPLLAIDLPDEEFEDASDTSMIIPAAKASKIDAQGFDALVRDSRRPAVFTGCSFGAAVKKWGPSHLEKICGSREVSVHVASTELLDFTTRNFEFEVMPFSNLIQRAFHPDEEESQESLYLRSMGKNFRKDVSNFFTDFPELAAEFELPACVPAYVRGERFFSAALRISSARTQLWTHYDTMDNILCNVVGVKRVCLWPPSQAANLYIEDSSSPVIDIDNPDLEKFPKFATAMKHCIQLVLKPGDMLFVPAMWSHNVRSLTPAVSVNVFWRHLDVELYQKKDLYGNKDPLPAFAARQHFESVLTELSKLPEDYRAFYVAQMTDKLHALLEMEDS